MAAWPLHIVRGVLQFTLLRDKQKQGGIAGRAFTDWVCIGCGGEGSHPDTNVPLLCATCRDTLLRFVNETGPTGEAHDRRPED